MRLSDLGERRLLELLREWTAGEFPSIALGAGDDAALLSPAGDRDLAVSTDAFVEGVHFTREVFSPEDIGSKAMAAALSDLAAMGAEGTAAFVNLFAPADTTVEFVRELYAGLVGAARAAGVGVAGGDTTVGALALGLTVVGTTPKGAAFRRGGARPGDAIFVSGTLGKSEAGRLLLARAAPADAGVTPAARAAAERAHLRPVPRFDVVRSLRELGRPLVTAMIDVSDGLGVDLARLCEASGVGCVVDEARVPVDEAARRIARSAGDREIDLALRGGEDFELVFTIVEDARDEWIAAAKRERMDVSEIGEITEEGGGRVLVRSDGGREPWPETGYDHYRRGGEA